MPPPATSSFDVARTRQDFPVLQQRTATGKPLIYLDNAASSQRPLSVIERMRAYASNEHANIHRGVHYLSQEATAAYEEARVQIAEFIGAGQARECIFVRGATEGINLVAHSWGLAHLKPGDRILLTAMEHHANIVPWQLIAERTDAHIDVVPFDHSGQIDREAFTALLKPQTRLVGLVHASNALGTINPAAELIAEAHAAGALVMLDGAQSTPHLPIDVAALDADFFVFSGHKVCGPTGIGLLYGKASLLEDLPPYQGGGDMIDRVRFTGTTYRGLPERFEAGTPNIEGALGLAAAIQYIKALGPQTIEAYEAELLAYATTEIQQIDRLTLYGTAERKVPVLSFTVDGIHPSDLGTMLDLDGVAVRTGHHCCMPLWESLGLEGSTRASLAFYNTREDIDTFMASLRKAIQMLG